jgi:hypothetical protein
MENLNESFIKKKFSFFFKPCGFTNELYQIFAELMLIIYKLT